MPLEGRFSVEKDSGGRALMKATFSGILTTGGYQF